MKILDLSAGYRGIWLDKACSDCIFLDAREETAPDVVADSRRLPFRNGLFDLIVFDPPHVNFGRGSNMSYDYGHHTTAQIRDIVYASAMEACRVAKAEALMAFKWNDHDQKIGNILALMRQWWKPLFGHCVTMRTAHASSTAWIMLRKLVR